MNSKIIKALKNFRKSGDISLFVKKLNSGSKKEREELIKELSLNGDVCNSGILIKILKGINDLNSNEVNYISSSIISGKLCKYYIVSSEVNNKYNQKIIDKLFYYGIKENENYILDAILSVNVTLDSAKKNELYDYLLNSVNYSLISTALNGELYDNFERCNLFNVYIKNKAKKCILNNYSRVCLDDNKIDSIVNIFVNEPNKNELDSLLQLIRDRENKEHINKIFECISKKADIYHFMKLLGSKRVYLVKEYILNTKNKSLIAFYIYYTKDYKLAKEIFGSIELFILYCNINKQTINFDTNELYKLLDTNYFNYVDDAIECYKIKSLS